jgi:hypothetical protein
MALASAARTGHTLVLCRKESRLTGIGSASESRRQKERRCNLLPDIDRWTNARTASTATRVAPLFELSGGTLSIELHDVLANDEPRSRCFPSAASERASS